MREVEGGEGLGGGGTKYEGEEQGGREKWIVRIGIGCAGGVLEG